MQFPGWGGHRLPGVGVRLRELAAHRIWVAWALLLPALP